MKYIILISLLLVIPGCTGLQELGSNIDRPKRINITLGNKMIGSMDITYTKEGKIKKIWEKYSNPNKNKYKTYLYNKNGLMQKSTYFKNNNTCHKYILHSYKRRLILKEEFYSCSNKLTQYKTFEYEGKRLKRINYYNYRNELKKYLTAQYENNRIATMFEFNAFKSHQLTIDYLYYKNNLLKGYLISSPNSKNVIVATLTYEKGNFDKRLYNYFLY